MDLSVKFSIVLTSKLEVQKYEILFLADIGFNPSYPLYIYQIMHIYLFKTV